MTRAVLHDYCRSSAAYRVRIALNMKGVEYERRPVNLVDNEQKAASYRALNPQGFVPMLEIDDHRLTQSLAICDYLDARFPRPPFVPKEPADRAHVVALALAVACDIHPLNNLRVLKYLSGLCTRNKPRGMPGTTTGSPKDSKRSKRWPSRGPAHSFSAIHQRLGDICLVPQMYNARRFNVPVDDYPTLVRADASASALPAFAAAHPDHQQAKP